MKDEVKILVAGDFCAYGRLLNASAWELQNSIAAIEPYIDDSDYSIVNLETAIVPDGNLSPIQKSGPAIHNSVNSIECLKNTGFNCVTLANNHFADYGQEALKYEFDKLSEHQLDFVGGGRNISEASETKFITIKSSTISIINCCEHEYTIADKSNAGANPLNAIEQYYKIRSAKEISDYVFVIVHGGHEFYQLPSPRMKQLYRFFIDAGADIVINHHQHCYSGFEQYNDGIIFYGLGNFCFDWVEQKSPKWNEGFCLLISIKDKIKFNLIPYLQCTDKPVINLMDANKRNEFDENILRLNRIIGDDNLLDDEFQKFVKNAASEYLSVLRPYQNKYLSKINRHKLLPSVIAKELLPPFLTEERLLRLLNDFQCEAHRDVMIEILKEVKNNFA